MNRTSPCLNIQTETLLSFKAGNRKAFEQLYDVYSPMLYGIISRIVGIQQYADEVLQQSFIALWQNRGTYIPGQERIFFRLIGYARKIAASFPRIVENVENISQIANPNLSDNVYTVAAQKNHPEKGSVAGEIYQQKIVEVMYMSECTYDIMQKNGTDRRDLIVKIKIAVSKLKTAVVV